MSGSRNSPIGPYQRAECMDCGEVWETPTPALMVGKKHAKDHGHLVFWDQETGGQWDFRGQSK